MADLEDPAVLTERMLRLAQAPPFSFLLTEDLQTVVSAGREVVCTSRTLLVPAEQRADAHYVALTGRLRALRNGKPVLDDIVRTVYGGLSLLSEDGIPADVVAEPGTVLFVLDRDVFSALLEENGSLGRTLLHAMSEHLIQLRRGQTVTSGSTVRIQPSGPGALDLVARMLLLRDALGLESRSLPVLTQLARSAQVRRTPAGRPMWNSEAGPADVVVVVQGSLELCQVGVDPERIRPGQALGLVEAIAGVPMPCEGNTFAETTSIVLSHGELQEAIDDHDDFALDLLRLLAVEFRRRLFAGAFDLLDA
jgi:CRP-like cAMP-binding protein